MPQNLVSLDLGVDAVAKLDQAIAALEAFTAAFVTLSAQERQDLLKMGDKSAIFCQQTIMVLEQNTDILPATFDYDEMTADMAAYEVLAKMEDTQMALGSDVMVAASEGYALMKLFGKAEGLSELQQAMRVRRPGRPRKGGKVDG